MIADTARVEPFTQLHESVRCGEFVLIGVQPDPAGERLPPTFIGAGSNIRSHTVIYAGNTIGRNFQTGHGAMIRECNRIGDDVSVGSHSVVEHDVEIGNNVRLHSVVFVPEYTVIEDDVWIGPGVVVTNAKYPNTPGAKGTLQGPTLKRGCVIGAGAVLLPGINVGYGAMVGAGAVVTRDIADNEVVVGDPARPSKAAQERVNRARNTK